MRGIRGERELVKYLEERGIVAIRVPASGAARKDVLPDVIAGYKGRIAFFEVKHAHRSYIPKERLIALAEKAERFGGEAFVAFRPKGTSEYYIIPAREAPSTIDKEKAKKFERLSRFIERYFFQAPSVSEIIGSEENGEAEE